MATKVATQRQIDAKLVSIIKQMNGLTEDLQVAFDLFESGNDDDFYATDEASDMRSAMGKVNEALNIVAVRLSEKMYAKLESEGVIS